jgi:hypothetical protein
VCRVKQGRAVREPEWREDEGEVDVGEDGRKVLMATSKAARRGRAPKPEADFPATTLHN